MNLIVILYPHQFNCYSKLNRKLSKILSNISKFDVVFPKDPNGLINNYFQSNKNDCKLIQDENWQNKDITHAIIFDDGEEFEKEIAFLKAKSIPVRFIRIKITRVVNIKTDSKYNGKRSTSDYEYIGRGSYWGNPYSMHENGESREEVIRKYKYDFDYDKFPNKEKIKATELAGKRLGCFCKPQDCHGDILADYLNAWDDGK